MGSSDQPQQPGHGPDNRQGWQEPEAAPGPLQWYGAAQHGGRDPRQQSPGSAGQSGQDPRQQAYGPGQQHGQGYRQQPYGPGQHAGQGPHQQPYGAAHGAPPWAGSGSTATVPPASSGPKPGGSTHRPRRRYELPAVAVLAALLASGATYGVGQLTGGSAEAAGTGTGTTTSAPVVQATGGDTDWTATAKAVAPSVVAIKVTNGQSGGQGSGVIIDTEGHVVTNNHVVTAGGSGGQITVTLNDKRTYQASVVGTDPSTDLAVLQIEDAPDDLTAISMGNSDKLRVGDPVMAVGNPLGLAGTVTTGIVSALDRPVTTEGESSGVGQPTTPVITNAIQTSAAINPGNSGGALVNASGQLVGINSSIATLGSSLQGGQSGNIGIGFAIPVSEVRSISDQLITNGTVEHAFLGVQGQDTTVQVGSAKRAAADIKVLADTPAEKAGLQTGDAVIKINGDSIDSWLSLVAQVHERTPGDKITVTVVRDGQQKDIDVTLGTNPDN